MAATGKSKLDNRPSGRLLPAQQYSQLPTTNLETPDKQRAERQRMQKFADAQPMNFQRTGRLKKPHETPKKDRAERQDRQPGQPAGTPGEAEQSEREQFTQEE